MLAKYGDKNVWIYYVEQCDFCLSKNSGCPYYKNTQELFKAIEWLDRNIHNLYGSFNYTCDYFKLNKKYYDNQVQLKKESCSNEQV